MLSSLQLQFLIAKVSVIWPGYIQSVYWLNAYTSFPHYSTHVMIWYPQTSVRSRHFRKIITASQISYVYMIMSWGCVVGQANVCLRILNYNWQKQSLMLYQCRRHGLLLNPLFHVPLHGVSRRWTRFLGPRCVIAAHVFSAVICVGVSVKDRRIWFQNLYRSYQKQALFCGCWTSANKVNTRQTRPSTTVTVRSHVVAVRTNTWSSGSR